jgi:O-acetyl-ADP-ribose deacetylase (regulator of RNase III)
MGVLTFMKGDIFHADVEALVNPVNTKGVAGAGLALQFRTRCPAAHAVYQAACSRNQLRPGEVYTVPIAGSSSRYIIYFPTKDGWWEKSHPSFISLGLASLTAAVHEHNIRSIALPALGCGLGGLSWLEVRSMIEVACSSMSEVDVRVYEPR